MTNSTPSPLTAEVGRIIAGLMKRYNVTQAQMAASLKISQSQLSKMLRGTRAIEIDQLDIMATGFEKSSVEILTEAEELVDEMYGPIDGTVFFVENGVRAEVPYVYGDVHGKAHTKDELELAARPRSQDRGEDLQ